MVAPESDVTAREHYDAARRIKIESEEQLKQAIFHLNASIELEPTYVSALLLRANIGMRNRDYCVAIADLSLVLQVLSGGLTIERRRLASVYGLRANIFVKQRKYQEALHDLQKAIEVESDNGVWLYEMGRVYLAQENQPFAQYYFQTCLNEKQYKLQEHSKFKALFSLGICRLRNGDTCGALTTFTKARDLNDTAPLRNYMGLSSYKAGFYKSAAEHFSRAVEMSASSYEYHFNLAITRFRIGDLVSSHLSFSTAALQKETPTLLYFRGLIQLGLKQLEEAKEDLDSAIKEDGQPRFYFGKCLLLMVQSKVDEAEEACKVALGLHPNNRRCLAHQGIIQHYRGNLHAAVKLLHQALDLQNDDPILTEYIGLVYSDLGHHDTAKRFFDRCCLLHPECGRFYFRKAVSQCCTGDFFGANESISIAIDDLCEKNPMSFHVRSVALKKLGRLDKALVWAGKAIAGNKRNPKFYLNRGDIFYQLRRYDECINDVDILVEIEKDSGEGFYLRGRALYAIRRAEEAAKNFQRAAELVPALLHKDAFHYCAGVVNANAGKLNEAEKHFSRAIECSSGPLSVVYYHERAKVYQAVSKPLAALSDLNMVLRYEPNNFNAILRRSFSLKVLGKFEEAAKDWRLARRLDKEGLLGRYDISDLSNVESIRFSPFFEEGKQVVEV